VDDSQPLVPPVSRQEILGQLDLAVTDHLEWLGTWHRALVCEDAPFALDLGYDPHHLGRFGSWYVKNQHRSLVNQPAIHALATFHRSLHDRARSLLAIARTGERLPRDAYDAFMGDSNSFMEQARRLEKAFAQASSDLDPLTGLHNRQAMVKELESERSRFLRTGRPCCIALGDLQSIYYLAHRFMKEKLRFPAAFMVYLVLYPPLRTAHWLTAVYKEALRRKRKW